MAEHGRGPGDRPALARCVPVDAATFAEDYWGRRPIFTRAASLPHGFDDLFSSTAVDELVADRALRTPFVRMAHEGDVLSSARYTGPGGFGAEVPDQLDADAVLAEFAAGATLVLQGLHRTWSPIASFARALAAELGHPCQVNAYVTPASSRGFDPHYDVHDVFVLQIAGEKHWRIHEPVHPDPLRDQPWNDHRAAVAARALETPAIDETFRPGDALYLPRGWIHSAEALGGVSVHLTIGVAAYTRADIVRAAIARAADTAALRASLPLGFDPDDTDALRAIVDDTLSVLRGQLEDPATRVRVTESVSAALGRRRASDSPPEPVRPLATLEQIALLSPSTRVQLRPGLRASVRGGTESGDDTVTLVLRTTTITLPGAAEPALVRLLDGRAIGVEELPELDTASAAVVARRLLREGVVTVVS